MNSFIPGIIIALLIVFLIGILVGYSLVQKRLRAQADALNISQRRLTEIEQSHELRLRETTDRLRHDYEAELAETIEHYQDQLSQKTVEMEQIYETRFRVLQQGGAPVTPQPLPTGYVGVAAHVAPAPGAAPSSPAPALIRRGIEPIADDTSKALTQPELMHLKRQYEIRLKEAAQKLQKAYEKQLAEHTRVAKADIEAAHAQQLLEKLEQYEQEFADRQAQLELEYEERLAALPPPDSTLTGNFGIPTPSQIMGTGDDTTVTLAASEPPPNLTPQQYSQADLEAQVKAAAETAEAKYEQRLTQQLEAQQVQFDRRFQTLEAEYKQKIAALENAAPESVLSPVDDLFSEDTYDDLATSSAPAAETSEDDSWLGGDNNDDDDDFGPLDLSDISQLT